MKEYSIPSDEVFWLKAMTWASGYHFACLLDGNNYPYPGRPFRTLLAVGNVLVNHQTDWATALKQKANNDWWFGYLGYDLMEASSPSYVDDRPVFQDFPPFVFFKAEVVLEKEPDRILIHSYDPEEVIRGISNCEPFTKKKVPSSVSFTAFRSRENYLTDVNRIQDQIREGNVYEVNLCQFFNGDRDPDGLSFFQTLKENHPMPFSGWMKAGDLEIASASPERYLQRKGKNLLSQPIKGTAPRGKDDAEDQQIRKRLLESEKELAENMMIVDLVRNDLARVSETGSTRVEEMFGIYSFPTVIQMISSIVSQLKDGLDSADAIRSSFPMGSMTGAPKQEVMKWIRLLEPIRRGAFSGALGYFGPGDVFDFNVLIRSLFVNHRSQTCGFAVGSAITIDSVPEQEWEECKIKASAILKHCQTFWEEIRF